MSGRWVTFDCYGTLIDWRTGMTAALESVAPGRSTALIAAYHTFEHDVESQEPFMRYREVLSECLRLAAERVGVKLEGDELDVLGRTLAEWPAFADTAPALDDLRAHGWKLGILSNVDRDMISGTLAGPLTGTFDALVTADDVGSYKPAAGHFDHFLALSEPDKWIHVGCSVFHDIRPARERSRPAILIDRDGDAQDAAEATKVLPGLIGLADVLEGVA